MSLTPPPPPPPAPEQPALPLLGSALLDLERRYQGRFEERGREILTGIGVVDEELLGGRRRVNEMGMGFERGTVVGLSACEGIEGRLISLHLLASVLISNSDLNIDEPTKPPNIPSATPVTTRTSIPTPKATIIDTTGSFPISLLAQVLKSRFRQAHQSCRPWHTVAVYSDRLRGDENDVHGKENEHKWLDALVQRALERVAVCRVFDVEGLWEVLGEVGRDAGAEVTTMTDQDDNNDTATVNNLEGEALHPLPEELSPTKEILDSQDQEQSDDEMLLEEYESTYHAVEPIRSVVPTETDDPLKYEESAKDDEEDDDDDGVELIIVDNMTHLITELFSKKEKSEAHSHLALLTRTLHTLTRHNNILTILHNTTVSSIPFNASSNASHIPHHDHNPPQNPNNYPFRPKTNSTRSVFPSNPLKPSLGLLFAPIPNLHLLLTRMPKRRQDAELLYAGGHNIANGELDATTDMVEECLVLEILKDETAALRLLTDGADPGDRETERGASDFGMRERKWVPLEVTENGLSLKAAFDDEEATWQGVGQKRRGGGDKGKEPETGRERGFVPRMFGFGGRRG